MSRIYFDTEKSGSVHVAGAERHWAGYLSDKIACAALGVDGFLSPEDPLVRAARPAWSGSLEYFGRALSYGGCQLALPNGSLVDSWHVLLNTAMSVGSPAVQILTTIHAQCEVHGWFAPGSFAVVAQTIQLGLGTGVMRRGHGWEDLAAFLMRVEEPVVMSYSVCERFPGVDEEGAQHSWAEAFQAIRENEITPLRLSNPRRFGAGLNGFDVRRMWLEQSP